MCIYIYIYIYMHMYILYNISLSLSIYIYIYIYYTEREREREREREGETRRLHGEAPGGPRPRDHPGQRLRVSRGARGETGLHASAGFSAPEGTKRATSVNVQLLRLQKDLRTGSISRDIVTL